MTHEELRKECAEIFWNDNRKGLIAMDNIIRAMMELSAKAFEEGATARSKQMLSSNPNIAFGKITNPYLKPE